MQLVSLLVYFSQIFFQVIIDKVFVFFNFLRQIKFKIRFVFGFWMRCFCRHFEFSRAGVWNRMEKIEYLWAIVYNVLRFFRTNEWLLR